VHIQSRLKALIGAMAVGAMAAISSPAFAANDAMNDLLKLLRAKGSITQEEYEALVQASKADAEAIDDSQNQLKNLNKTLAKTDTKGRLETKSADGDFSWRIGGRIHWDTTFYNNDTGNFATTTLASGTDMRRGRLDMTATAWKNWQFKIQYDFADNVDQVDEGLRDAYIKYVNKDGQPFTVTLGQFKEYITMEEIISSNDVTFVERALATGAFDAPNGRRLGIGITAPFADMWTASAGVFGRALGSAGENDVPQLVAGPPASLSPGDDDDSDPLIFTGRLTFSPIHTSNRVLHLGVAGSLFQPEDDDAVRFRARPEARVGADRLVDSGGLAADDVTRFGVEGAGVYGPFSLQGEWLYTSVDGNTSSSPDPDFSGWYVYGTYLLTGESRIYRFEDGVFQNPKPNNNFGGSGMGAWELAVRYSTVDLNDGSEGIFGGQENNVTVGLNWYPNPNLKFMANWVQVLDIDDPNGGFDGAEPGMFEFRAQAYW